MGLHTWGIVINNDVCNNIILITNDTDDGCAVYEKTNKRVKNKVFQKLYKIVDEIPRPVTKREVELLKYRMSKIGVPKVTRDLLNELKRAERIKFDLLD